MNKRFYLFILMVNVGLGCRPTPQESPSTELKETAFSPSFEEITQSAGVDITYRNGREAGEYAIIESLGGGGALWDFDLDGRLDIFCTGGGHFSDEQDILGHPNFLYRNRGNLAWGNVTKLAGCDISKTYTHGCAIADADEDGFPDLLITGYAGVQLWMNQGDGTFLSAEVDAELNDTQWSSSAGWADLNGDGFLDLYTAHYVDWSFDKNPVCAGSGPDGRDVCPPRQFTGLDDAVFLNSGDGTFQQMSQEIGLEENGKGLGVLLADFDHDSDTDIYVANDTTPNFYYRNDGSGHFTEDGLVSGTALNDIGQADGSMGLAMGDFDSDGLVDIWVANFEMEAFAMYRNQGGGGYQHVSREIGVAALGGLYVGFGTIAEDFDLDSDLDLVVLNGHIIYYPQGNTVAQAPLYIENENGKTFRRKIPNPESGYFQQNHIGRGLASGDFDNDGRVDLLAVHLNQPASLLRNTTQSQGRSWKMRLVGTSGNRDGIGARVLLHTTQGDQLRQLSGGGSYLSHNDKTLVWGVAADAEVTGATIYWPGGETQEVSTWTVGQTALVYERGDVVLLP